MSSSESDGEIGSTLELGIQDIAAIIPLLGSDQCAEQVSSALTRGYLYAAATPMSIFGSLGVVIAGFKTLIACISFGGIEGAKILGNMGFEPQGENLSLIMVESGKGKDSGRYIIETRIEELIKELNIDQDRITGVSQRSTAWNVKMIDTTALLKVGIPMSCFSSGLKKGATWVRFLRATGSFIGFLNHHSDAHSTTHTTTNNQSFRYLVKRNQQPNTERYEQISNNCTAHRNYMAAAIYPPYRSRSIHCGLCLMFDVLVLFRIRHRPSVPVVGSAGKLVFL